MIKRLLKLVSILVLIAIVIAGVFLYSIYVSVDKVSLNYETLSSTKIPTSLNDTKIAFISDIKYNEFMDKERLTTMINEVNEAGVDIVIFGGDVFRDPLHNKPDSQDIRDLTKILKSMKAPLGKFAVLGEEDLSDKTVKSKVESLLFNSDFEIITNTNIRIRNDSSTGINLIGLDSLLKGNPNTDKAMKKITSDSFNILVTHCPDSINDNDLNSKYIDVMLSGHSLGGQIYIPILGSLHSIDGAKSYYHGNYTINDTTLYVSNGLGTTEMDMRLFCPPEVLIFRLQHES